MPGHADDVSVLLYCKRNAALGKSSGLIFGNGGIAGLKERLHEDETEDSAQLKRFKVSLDETEDSAQLKRFKVSLDETEDSAQPKRFKVSLRLDQAGAMRFPFKKTLMLNNLSLAAADIPMKNLCDTALGKSLRQLSLAVNRLGAVPAKLVQSLPMLRALDLSQCKLHQLPDQWNLPKLTRLNLSHNRFTEFPVQTILRGLPELRELNMYGNKVTEIVIPDNVGLLPKLYSLDLGYNDLVCLPDNLDQLKSLRVLKVMNNFLSRVPQRVCDMRCLKTIDVSSNPVRQPPIKTCERGVRSMRHYWYCIAKESENTRESLATSLRNVQQRLQQQTDRSKGRIVGAELRHNMTSHKQPSNGKSKDQDEQEKSNGLSAKDHGHDSNEPFASPKSPPLSWWTRRANDSVKVGPSFKDQVHSVEDSRSRQTVVAAARSNSAHAPPAAAVADEKVLGLPSFKDQIRDRPRCHPNEERIGDGVAAATTSPSIEPKAGPAFKDQVRENVFPSERPPSLVDLDPTVVFADACLLGTSELRTPVLPAHVLEQNAESSLKERTKKELAEKDAEIKRLKEQNEALAQAANQNETVDHLNESSPLRRIQRLNEQVESMSNAVEEAKDQQSPPKP